ncbi:Crp/Fnr family transcriptional regulator [Oceanicoccus sagamiensis]|uniref:Crp/Fnr family transcriptional regulator n=1 Tax=Oceanicoccus sagamiensis TaxID=716816 RepID=A0A1X9NHR2_9GAMM|nr:Crp/Fnr family transcriptional regulator [Oceanicoccus sagamiensis]ARN75049.1 hypothetical protein BST96_13560 [Oceanicoccus sagamiensis]
MKCEKNETHIYEEVSRCVWFKDLPDSELEALATAARIKYYSTNSYLYTIGEKTTDVFCLLSGHVRISMEGSGEQKFAIHDVWPTFWLGDDSLTGDDERVMEAQVVEAGEVLLIPRSAIEAVAEKHPLIYRNFYIEYAKRTRISSQLLSGILFLPLRARLAGRILELVEMHGEQTDEGILMDVRLNQNDFASMSLGSRQRINRIIREWIEADVLVMRGDQYLIVDINALRDEIKG